MLLALWEWGQRYTPSSCRTSRYRAGSALFAQTHGHASVLIEWEPILDTKRYWKEKQKYIASSLYFTGWDWCSVHTPGLECPPQTALQLHSHLCYFYLHSHSLSSSLFFSTQHQLFTAAVLGQISHSSLRGTFIYIIIAAPNYSAD